MIGRGARRLNNKKTFHCRPQKRFGEWHAPIDWQHVFENPEIYHEVLHKSTTAIHHIPSDLRSKSPNSLELSFDVLSAYQEAMAAGKNQE